MSEAARPEARTTRAGRSRPRGGLRRRLFLSYLLIIAVGVIGLLGATSLLAPRIFERHMQTMMGSGAADMQGMTVDSGMMAGMARSIDEAFRAAMLQALLLSAGAATLAAVAVSLWVSARIVTPVQRLLVASRRIAAGQYAQRVTVHEPDELGVLADQFNLMAAALETAERQRVALIGDVAHELRTPLATLEGYTEGLLDGIIAPDTASFVLLHDEVGRLRRLVQDLQDVSRAEARQILLHPRPVTPLVLVEQALTRMRPQYEEKGVGLRCDVPDRLPFVAVDPDRILQVLINLLGNALRHTAAGGTVTVSATIDADAVAFHVVDSGIGIAAEHLPHLFERFYRVDKARSRALGGSGIGLTIVKALVEAHDGRVWAESRGLGQGATFSFTLPCASRD